MQHSAKSRLLVLRDLVQIYQTAFAVAQGEHAFPVAFPVASPSACCVCLAHPTPNGCATKPRLFCFFQMSKSTGNFLTLSQAVDKFSADGEYVLTCRWVSVRPEGLTSVFCSRRSRAFVGVKNCSKSAAYHLFLFEKLNSV